MKNSKPMRPIYISIDFDKNDTDGHQIDQITEKPIEMPKKLRFYVA